MPCRPKMRKLVYSIMIWILDSLTRFLPMIESAVCGLFSNQIFQNKNELSEVQNSRYKSRYQLSKVIC